MNSAIAIVGLRAVVPAAIAIAGYVLTRRLLAAETSNRYAAALAFGAGAALLTPGMELVPGRHWHWMPYLALGAAVIGPIAASNGLRAAERGLLFLLTAIVCAWLLVPRWASLAPSRAVWVPLLAGDLVLLAALLEPLFELLSARILLASLALAAACVAALIAAFVSVTYAGPAGSAASAMVGCWVVSLFGPASARVRGLGLAYSVVVGGWAFIGCIDPPKPLLGLLVAPAAPLALWACVRGPLSRPRGLAAVAVQFGLVLLVLAIAIGIVAGTVGVL
jgi:hypothetical protein